MNQLEQLQAVTCVAKWALWWGGWAAVISTKDWWY